MSEPTHNKENRNDPLSGIVALVQTSLQEISKIVSQVERLTAEQRTQASQTTEIMRILRGEGNGDQGMLWRMRSLEVQQKAMGEDVHLLRSALDTRNAEEVKGRWGLAQGASVAIVALIASVLGALISGLLGMRR